MLTNHKQVAMIASLSQKTKVGICSPDNGHNRPLYTVVFLCPPKTQTALRRFNSVMAGYLRQPLKRLAGSVTGTANLIYSATRCFAALCGGYSPYNGVTAMRKYANPAISSQSKTYKSLFNLIKQMPDGKRVICQDITFTQASALVAEIPSVIVKFSRMEVAQ